MQDRVSRRSFVEATGCALGLGAAGCASVVHSEAALAGTAPLRDSIRDLVDLTPLMDTHEHLPPEADRVANLSKSDATPAPDFGMLMSHYTDSDLQVAGLSPDDYKQLIGRSLSPRDKWKLVAPYYERCRHTGYQICMRESIRALFGESDLREDTCEAISLRLHDGVRPDFYRHILRDVANIEHAQINALESRGFREGEPASDLLSFDISTVSIASNVKLDALSRFAGTEVTTLAQAHQAIEQAFERFGPKAIAVKDQSAYSRRLNYEDVSDESAAPLFARLAGTDPSLTAEERKAVQDNLFRHCLRCATDYKLPVKLHTGYYAGHGGMDLAKMRDNFCDIARVANDFPNTTFVLMHIGYPYQHELIALCKHCPNIYADMCWAWIIDPASATRFLKEFIMGAPACKLLTFGGDFIPVEMVAGHARMARQGIALAIACLVEERWLDESDVQALVERIMRGNAHEIFDLERVLRAYA